MERQSGLGTPQIHRSPRFDLMKIAKVYSVKDYEKYGRIEVVFLDYGRPAPVWVVGDIDRKPSVGDQVLVGYIDGRKDSPYLSGFVRGYNATDNYIKVEKGKIQLKVGNQVMALTSSGATLNGKRIAVAGDTVRTNVNGTTYSGTIS